MSDFLAAYNICGQTLLRLVSRGNAIIAELMRLKDYVPPVFSLNTKQLVQKYGSIINDFSYFNAANVYEQKIEDDPVLQETDEELRNSFSDILSRFYLAFESVHKYVTDLNLYVDELADGTYIHLSLDSIMLNEEGKQLMCEAVYLYGVMLLLLDYHFEGRIRERLLVSYYRYNAQRSSSTRVDDVCMLLRSTGYIKTSFKRPVNYPEDYFRRVPLNDMLIEIIIGRLRADELYNQTLAFPHPEHRSTALSTQASMLIIILFFKPVILHTHTAIMREIVDKFFPDNWVISIYMGIVINLTDWWLPYKAARTALNNTLELSNIKRVAQLYGQKMEKLLRETEEVQLTVTLDENATESLVKLVRNCNVTLHWILLHTTMSTFPLEDSKRSRTLRQLVITESKYMVNDCLRLLLSTAQIEQDVKQMYKELLVGKETKWFKNKETCIERITDLAQIFAGSKSLDGIEKNQNLHRWFTEISVHIGSLQQEDSRKIVQLLQALEEVQEFHQLENNLHISQYLADTREILHNMLRTGSITEDIMISLNIVTDCCYAWHIMESFINVMQASIKESPPTVIKLKALFLKMASALETPLLRINQARSADLSSVSQYYSRELEGYARRVLQIIPETVFGLLAQIVYLETNAFKEIPTKLPKDKLKDYAQLDDRLKMAKLTYAVSVFTKGVLSLRSVSLGVLRVDSHRLLEDGIRQELVKKVTLALDNSLIFDPKSKTTLSQKLFDLASIMDGYRKSFHYIQDYININSLKIWHEEITYIINSAVEEEQRGFSWILGKTQKHLPDDKHLSIDSNCTTFMGRLARELIRITDPRTTVYIEHSLAWYDIKTQSEILNYKIFSTVLDAIGTPGLSGLDKLISFFIVIELESISHYIEKRMRNKTWASIVENCEVILRSADNPKGIMTKIHTSVGANGNKLWQQILEYVLKIGHYQIFRKKIAYELNTACKFEAKHMEAALQTLNTAVLSEIGIKNWFDKKELEENHLFYELSLRLDWAGISDPLNKVYIKPTLINSIAFMMFLFTISQLNKLQYCKNSASLLSKKPHDPLDAVVFTVGIQTVLRQFHTSITYNYIKYFCVHVLSFVASDSAKIGSEPDVEGIVCIHFLELFAKYSGIPRSFIFRQIPAIILDHCRAKMSR